MITPVTQNEFRTPLVDTLLKFDSLTEQITQNMEKLERYTENLSEFKDKMGSPDDTRTLRKRMTHDINKGNETIKKIQGLLKEVGGFKFRRTKDSESSKKMVRRLNHSFEEHHEAFTKALKEIHSREKIFLELKRSLTSNSSESITITSDAEGSHQDLETFEEACNNFEFIASIIEERQVEVENKKKLGESMVSNKSGKRGRENTREQTRDLSRDLESSNLNVNDTQTEINVRVP